MNFDSSTSTATGSTGLMSDEPTVFIVDDDEGARNSVRALVRSMGVNVETFSSAESFLEALNPASPGCLVTDVRMLGMSGIELQEKMVSEGVKLPVIIITAVPSQSSAIDAIDLGVSGYIPKPFELPR